MTTTIDALTGQSTTDPGDYLIIHNTAANRTRKVLISDFTAELAADLDIVTNTTLNAAIASVTSAYQAADSTKASITDLNAAIASVTSAYQAADTTKASIALLNSSIASVTSAYQAADLVALQKVFPIGSKISLIGVSALTNPATSLGFGTWIMEQGKFYVGYKAGDSIFGTVGAGVGDNTHNHTGTSGSTVLNGTQIPSHYHGYKDTYYTENSVYSSTAGAYGEYAESRGYSGVGTNGTDYDNDTFFYKQRNTDAFGGTQGHTHTLPYSFNIPESIVEVVWRRTA